MPFRPLPFQSAAAEEANDRPDVAQRRPRRSRQDGKEKRRRLSTADVLGGRRIAANAALGAGADGRSLAPSSRFKGVDCPSCHILEHNNNNSAMGDYDKVEKKLPYRVIGTHPGGGQAGDSAVNLTIARECNDRSNCPLPHSRARSADPRPFKKPARSSQPHCSSLPLSLFAFDKHASIHACSFLLVNGKTRGATLNGGVVIAAALRRAAIGCAAGLPRRSASRHWLPTGSRGYQSGATTGASRRRARSNYFPARPLARQRRWLPRLLSCPPPPPLLRLVRASTPRNTVVGGDDGRGNSRSSRSRRPPLPGGLPKANRPAFCATRRQRTCTPPPPPLATPRRPAFQPAPDTEATTPALYAADRRHGAHTPERPRCCDRGFRPPPSPPHPPSCTTGGGGGGAVDGLLQCATEGHSAVPPSRPVLPTPPLVECAGYRRGKGNTRRGPCEPQWWSPSSSLGLLTTPPSTQPFEREARTAAAATRRRPLNRHQQQAPSELQRPAEAGRL
ncbi:hypothetical protein MTO96_010529 [Rhipicephalus appendiculatus]